MAHNRKNQCKSMEHGKTVVYFQLCISSFPILLQFGLEHEDLQTTSLAHILSLMVRFPGKCFDSANLRIQQSGHHTLSF